MIIAGLINSRQITPDSFVQGHGNARNVLNFLSKFLTAIFSGKWSHLEVTTHMQSMDAY